MGTFIKHTPKASLIQMIPYQNVPTYLRLYKQRYRCKACGQTISAKTNIVDERCYLSNALKFAILHDLKQKCAMTDIAKHYFVSPKSVERILKSYSYELLCNYQNVCSLMNSKGRVIVTGKCALF
nr:helix-turn-helix domain-containing protein [Enterococcus cecorum]